MNDPETPRPTQDGPEKEGGIPEPSTRGEPRFDAPSPPAPEVIDAPGRNTEF